MNKATKSQASDIPDNGMLISVNSSGDAGAAAMPLLYNASPIYHVSRIQTPVYLMIGANDRRVPPSQGYLLYHELMALGKENVKLNVYDDCHPLSKVVTHTNVMINTALFYDEYREQKK